MSYGHAFALELRPPERAREIPAGDREKIAKQEVFSVRPRFPPDIRYIGTMAGRDGMAYDYYKDPDGGYWYESRKQGESIITKYKRRAERKRKMRAAR